MLLSGDAKFAAYLDAGVFVLPSLSEQLTRVVLEARASSVPVLIIQGSDVPLISAFEAGYVIRPGQSELQKALMDLLSDSQLRANLGQNGRRMVGENFGWERAARRLEDIYRMAIHCDGHEPG